MGEQKKFHPEEVASMVLTKTKETTEAYLRNQMNVVTVSANFSVSQRQATKDTWSISGLNVLRVNNEPNTAEITYELDKEGDGNRSLLIHDVVGDTFDVSSLSMSRTTSSR